jgi:hypothetical protein
MEALLPAIGMGALWGGIASVVVVGFIALVKKKEED